MNNDYKVIDLTGTVYIKDLDDHQKKVGDIRLFMNIEKELLNDDKYHCIGVSGYFKAEVFDGKFWQLLDLDEFLFNREYKFSKTEVPIYTANLCIELLKNETKFVTVYRTYRGHFTRDEYVKEERVTKANRNRKKK
jgi:hypothetical protein